MLLHCLGNRIVNGHAEDFLPSLAWGNAGHDIGPVTQHRLGMKTAHVPGDALNKDSGICANDDAHNPAKSSPPL